MCILHEKVIYAEQLVETGDSRTGSFEALRAIYASSVKRIGLFNPNPNPNPQSSQTHPHTSQVRSRCQTFPF